jgi:DnaJ-class molecular chaperone
MSTVTRGLKKRPEAVSIRTKPVACGSCGGSGEIVYGGVEVVSQGIMQLHDECGNCDGLGEITRPLRKIKRKSKVEVMR